MMTTSDLSMTIGQVVQLRSGGPAMTVFQVAGSKVRCTWFDGFELRNGQFERDLVETPLPSVDDADAPNVHVDNFG